MPRKKTCPEKIKKFKETIIERLSAGASLKSILDKDKDLPSRVTVYKWLNENEQDYDQTFFNNYLRAKEDQADLNADEIEEIARNTLQGKYDPNAARVAIAALQWTAGKKRPKKYGKKVDFTTDGEKLGNTIAVEIIKPKEDD